MTKKNARFSKNFISEESKEATEGRLMKVEMISFSVSLFWDVNWFIIQMCLKNFEKYKLYK